MKRSDALEHFKQLAQNAGLDSDAQAAVLKALENETFANELAEGVMRKDEFSRNMDSVNARAQELDEWYNKTALPAYQTNLSGIETLRKYEQTYGPLEVAGPANSGNNGATMDADKILQQVDERLKARDVAVVALQKDIADMTFDYYQKFGEKLDLDEVENLSRKTGLPARQAYKEYISPKLEARQKTEFEEKLKQAREEGYRDAVSKHHLPVDSTPREQHPFFDRQEPKAPVSELEQDRASRNAFMEGWNDYAVGLQKNANK